jgi:hypothetical protein
MISARDLAQRYAAYLHAQLVGDDTEAVDFGLWLDEHWTEMPPLPDEPLPDSLVGEADPGNAVTWIEHDGEIVGLLAGRPRGCYRIPIDSSPPVVALFADDAMECSTGSVRQERAFASGRNNVLLRPMSIPVSRMVERRSQPQGLLVKLLPPLAADITLDESA